MYCTSLHSPFSRWLDPTACLYRIFCHLYITHFLFVCVCFILYFLIFVCFSDLSASFPFNLHLLDSYIGRHSKGDDSSYFICIYYVFLMWKVDLLPLHAEYNFSCIKVYKRLMIALKAKKCNSQQTDKTALVCDYVNSYTCDLVTTARMSRRNKCLLHFTTSQHAHQNTRGQFQGFTGINISVDTKAPKMHEDQTHIIRYILHAAEPLMSS